MADQSPTAVPAADDAALEVPRSLRLAGAWGWRVVATAAGIAVVAWALWELRVVTVPLFLAMLFATLLLPLTDLLDRRMPRVVAVLISVIAFITAIWLVTVLVIGSIVGEAGQLASLLSDAASDVTGWVRDRFGTLSLDAAEVEKLAGEVGPNLTKIGGGLIRGAVGETTALVGSLITFVLSLAFLLYVLQDAHELRAWLVRQFPPERREDASAVLTRSWTTLGGYVRGTVVVAIWDTVLIGAAILALGLPIGGTLIVITFVAAFIPILGAYVAAFIVVLVALTTEGADAALVMIAVQVVVRGLESAVIAPVVYRRTVNLHPIATLAVVTAGGALMGVIGAIVAVPLAAVAWTVFSLLRPAHAAAPATPPTPPAAPG